jgi:hypothetical protein
MKNALFLASMLLVAAPVAVAQAGAQTSQQTSFKFLGDGLSRYEWTRDLFDGGNLSRWRIQARPRVELAYKSLVLGVGGEANRSQDENTKPPAGATSLAIVRDNYKSRDVRLDLAFLSLKPVGWLQLQGGRFMMPFGLTEMIWDKDIRPQGGAITFEHKNAAGQRRFALTGLYGQGSHRFLDEKAQMFLGQAEIAGASFSLTGSYIEWRKLPEIEPMIRRQNSRVAGAYTKQYQVVDGVLRLSREGQVNSQLIVDYCRNLKVSEANQGLWIALVLGSTTTAKGKLEYTYATVDKDATLAAYATDDFFWGTGWAGHRGDLGFRLSDKSAFHIVTQWQRFKDSARLPEQDHWLKRYRAEVRVTY